MKLLVDLFSLQTTSRFRGIGRYVHSLVTEMIRLRGANEFVALANSMYAGTFEQLRQEFIRLLPAGGFLPYSHNGLNVDEGDNDPYFDIAATLGRHVYQVITPDIILYPSIFEGWGEQGAVPLPEKEFPSSFRSAIIYDFIPYRFYQQFLEPDPYNKQYYSRRLNLLKSFDLLLAISESTRKDAIEILNISPDKVVNISAAASPIFKKIDYTKDKIGAILSRFNISKPFVFYTGNVEYHKNLDMALRVYAQLPHEIRATHQFVLTHVGDEKKFISKLDSIGLRDDEIVIVSHATDDELIALYNLCKLFIFPSLYEGFGLPILEAMACGAPVIASNCTSIPEIINREDVLFDPTDEGSILRSISHALSDDNFRIGLSAYGLERSRQFSWEKSARRAWQAIEAVAGGRQESDSTLIFQESAPSKSKIAYVTPLPPQKTGVAAYSAELLPDLSLQFEIDLYTESSLQVTDRYIRQHFNIRPWTELLNHRDEYETVVFQMGNSEFHRYMFQLLREIQGVVVLHDFFLSHLKNHYYAINTPQDSSKNFLSEAGAMHGISCMVDFIQHGFDSAIWDWPMNWDVLKNAQEIIVHSDYQNNLIKQYYGKGWYPRPTIVRQLHRPGQLVTSSIKKMMKEELQINPNAFVFCSFGFINATKHVQLIIQAFADFLSKVNNASLVFVGELDKGEFGLQIQSMVQEYGLEQYIRITGFIDNSTYEKYLNATDVAIQLRSNSRGETSRAVLDCMANGIPTIVNSHGSLNDFDSHEVIKISEFPSSTELMEVMVHLRRNDDFRIQVGTTAQKSIKENYRPEIIANSYSEVIHRAALTSDRHLFSPLIDSLMGNKSTQDLILSSAKYAAKNLGLRNQPRILIDVTNISNVDLRTGIQRVVKNLIKGIFSNIDFSTHLELCRLIDKKLSRSARFTETLFELPPGSLGEEVILSIQPGDILFMLDTSWNNFDQFLPIFDQVRKMGGKLLTMIHDMIPLQYPELCTEETVIYFKKWIRSAVSESDGIVCVSQTVADNILNYIKVNHNPLSHQIDLSYVHNGADIPVITKESTIRTQIQEISKLSTDPLFLMVGTIEPRKRHDFALDAFDLLWSQGSDYRLFIAGKVGWNVDRTEQRIRNHPEIYRKLFFVDDASDAEINLLYSSATSIIIPSLEEGFGLPIVEAALYKVPSIASDIPVFHEVAGEGAEYFTLNNRESLMKAIQIMVNRTQEERILMAKKIEVLTWEESAKQMLEVIEGKKVYKSLSNSNFLKSQSDGPGTTTISYTSNSDEKKDDTLSDDILVTWRNVSIESSKGFEIALQTDSEDDITTDLLNNRFELPPHYYFLLDVFPIGARVLDLGAHIGTFSLFAAANGYQVLSVEASPLNCSLLNKSLQINKFNNGKSINAAVSDHSGVLEFVQAGPYGAVKNQFMSNSLKTISVPAITVDSILELEGWEHVELIKMDIEGSEVAAIHGMEHLLSQKDGPAILYESNGYTLGFFGLTPQDLTAAMETFGYRCYFLQNKDLFPITSSDPQYACVADCLAIKQMPAGINNKWRIQPPMLLETKILLSLQTCHLNNPIEQAFIGRALERADTKLLSDLRIIDALEKLKEDPVEDVRTSVKWWVRKSDI